MARTVLVVDDEKSVRETLRFLLERHGYAVALAENGQKALEIAARQPIDGALIDVHMAGMNGVAVCRALRAQAEASGRSLPVWMMTGAKTSDIVRAAQDAGALMVLGKPFDYADLFRRFEAAFGGDFTSAGDEPA